MAAAAAMASATPSRFAGNAPVTPGRTAICAMKNRARLAITPTTAAVKAVSGAWVLHHRDGEIVAVDWIEAPAS